MSFCRAGAGPTTLTGPVTSGWSSRCSRAPTSSTSVIHGQNCRPQPSGPAETEAAQAQQRLHRAAVGGHDDAGPRERHRGAGVDRRCRRGLPGEDDVGEEAGARGVVLGELLVAAVAVEAHGRPGDEPDRVVGAGHGGGDGGRAVGARGEDLVLVRGRPAPVADARPRRGARRRRRRRGRRGSRARLAGSQRTSSGADGARRTSRTTSSPRSRSAATRAVPISPERPGDGDTGHGVDRQRPRSASNAPSSSRCFIVDRKRAASAPSTIRWS